MPDRVLVVCVGNICRSPTAEAVLRHRLRERAIVVESAGLAALQGNAIDPLAEQALNAHGLTAQSHIARQVDRSMIENADLVLAAEKRHLAALRALAPRAGAKMFLLGKWRGNADIADPYGRDKPAFERAYEMIDAATIGWLSRI